MKVTIAQCEAALRDQAGITSLAAKKLGIDRTTLFRRIQGSERLQRVVADLDETILDSAVGVVVKAITKDNDAQTARWYLDRKGHKRGFIVRHELGGKDGGPIPVKLDLEGVFDGLPEEQVRALLALRSAAVATAVPEPGPGAGLGAATGAREEDQGTGEG